MSKVVGHGRIRVDARKAVEKLREHLLVDLQLYPLEIVRAAVAGGAREVDVSSDGGTVGITFDGAPPPAEALPRLLDHVLDVSPEREARRLRLLALGLNAALGLRPASVDLTLSTDEGCTRVRWTPDLLDAGAGGSAAPLPAPEVVPRPEGMPPRALRIEVRPRFGWGAIRKALGGGLPREVELLLDATFALPARLTVGGAPPPPRPRSPPLLAVPFDARGAVRAALEIVPIGPRAPEIEILEHGVLMLRAPVRFALAMPGTGAEEAHLPIRIVVDAEELPVNLSRSALREDSSFCQPIERAAVTALAEAVRRWAGERADGRPRDRLPEPTRERAIERAMAAILGRIGRLALRGDSLPPELAALLDLPLCRSAYGGPLSIAAINALPAPLSIHREPEPLSEALRPFLGEVLRVTDALAEELAGERAAVDVRELLDEAEVGVTLSRQLAVHDRDAARLLAARADLGELGEEVRITFAALSTAIENLGATSAALPRSLLAFAGLSELPIWPTVEPGRRASIAALKATAERCGALFSAAPGVKGRAADGRLVLAVADDEIRPIAGALGVPIIPYGDGLIDPGDARAHEERSWHRLREALAVEAGDGPALAIARPGLRARVAVSASPRVRLCHAGEALGGAPPPPDLGALAIAVDSDALVPNPGWTAPLAPPSQAALSALLQPIDQAYCERLVAALEGDPAARAELDLAPGEGGAARDRLICNYLLDRAGHLRALPGGARPERAALAARIEALPLISVLDEEGRPEPCALADLARWHPAPLTIPALQAPPGFATLGWRPVLLHAVEERALLQRWSNERLYLAIDEIPGRKRDAERERLRRELLTHPPLDPGDLGDLADPGAFSVQLRPEGGKRIALVAALPRAGVPIARAWVDVLYHQRAVCRAELSEVALPVVARVDLTEAEDLHDFRALSPAGRALVVRSVLLAAGALGRALLDGARGPGRSAALFADARALDLIERMLRVAAAAREAKASRARSPRAPSPVEPAGQSGLLDRLTSNDLGWPTVQGDHRPFAELSGTAQAIFVGSAIHVPWRGPGSDAPHELDRPVLHAPESGPGDPIRALCDALGRKPRDVTEGLRKLQERRAAAAPAEPPRLPGAPAHPALRVSIAALGLPGIEGELEIVPDPQGSVTLLDPVDDTPRQVTVALPFPIRILARADSADPGREATRSLLEKLSRAAVRHLLDLVPRFDELPSFPRAHLRAMVCKAVGARRKVQRRAAAAPIFEDIDGAYRSLDRLRQDPTFAWGATEGEPPYPAQRPALPILRLSKDEMTQLAEEVHIKNLTGLLRRRLEAERRAAAIATAETSPREAAPPPDPPADAAERAPLADATAPAGEAPVQTRVAPAKGAEIPAGDGPPRSTQPPPGTWIQGILRKVRAFFGDEELSAGESPVSLALLQVILALRLPGSPVEAVVESRAGRPLRYQVDAKRLVLNRSSPALGWLGPESHRDPRAMGLLAAAAITEIRRVFPVVTAEDETRALMALLDQP